MKMLNEEISRIKELINLNESSSNEGTFKAPLAGSIYVTSPFGAKRSYETHPGVDLRAKSGTQILSPADGVIVTADANNNPKCGGTIDIKFNDGLWGRFCHVKQIYKKKGDPVSQGDVLGLSGGDANDPGHGNSQNAHIHFTLKKDGVLVDPMKYIDKVQVTTGNPITGDLNNGNLFNLFSGGDIGNTSYYSNFLQKLFRYIFSILKENNEYGSFGKKVSIHSKDILIPYSSNDKIKSPISGVIQNYTYNSECKNQVSVKHTINNQTFYLEYCGIKNVSVSRGDNVSKGTTIGTTDSDVEVYFYNESGRKQYIEDVLNQESTSKSSSTSYSSDKRDPINLPSKQRSPINLPSKQRSPINLPSKPRSPIVSLSSKRSPL
jgi:hypothetical protein